MIVREHISTAVPTDQQRKLSEKISDASTGIYQARVGHVSEDNSDMKDLIEKDYTVAAGRRLRTTREALGFNSVREFAAMTNVTEHVLSAWERGKALVRPWYVSSLKQKWGITHDWIYDGDVKGLPYSLATKILDRTS
ncbi:helix-turn-helix domain-containing protein [Azospirillum sp. B506]|uniref:helix-turn-helix domain-containing protein n=1 Tax=Azospirillum sp. B506 TaxID=137721 RepID=UPI00034BF0C9|nr:helix-turn-helix domain-containing protein [Azospirillum sp. B506]